MTTKTKLLKWAGSKSQVSDQIRPYLSFDRAYVEPFCGSAFFFFENSPAESYLNDLNFELICFFKHTRNTPNLVWYYYDRVPVEEVSYYQARDTYNELGDCPEKAGLFVYLNHFCFNGLYRTNKAGEFNTPYGGRQKPKRKLSRDNFQEFSQTLRSAHLTARDFEAFLDRLDPDGACIYMDPPYFTNDERVFGEYGSNTFKKIDLQRLLEVSVRMSRRNKVVVSYKNCSEFREAFRKYIVGDISVIRNVGGFAGRRKSEQELVAVLGG
ncbi:MAG: DNA adenine methylase [Pikeienuella sp.]|uniref:DNA adenine methylase n=1 Tax=Pikeienuella sp. TaxID=2831957 RepID=UPI00391916FA